MKATYEPSVPPKPIFSPYDLVRYRCTNVGGNAQMGWDNYHLGIVLSLDSIGRPDCIWDLTAPMRRDLCRGTLRWDIERIPTGACVTLVQE